MIHMFLFHLQMSQFYNSPPPPLESKLAFYFAHLVQSFFFLVVIGGAEVNHTTIIYYVLIIMLQNSSTSSNANKFFTIDDGLNRMISILRGAKISQCVNTLVNFPENVMDCQVDEVPHHGPTINEKGFHYNVINKHVD